MIRLFADTYLYFSFNATEHDSLSYGDRYVITALTREKEVNSLSSISFTTMMDHPRFSSLVPKRTLIVLLDDNRCLFIGKVATIKKNIFQGTAEVECEEILGCLRDSCVVDNISKEYDDMQFEYQYSELLHIGLSGMTNEQTWGTNTKLGYNCSTWLPYAIASINGDTMLNAYTVENISGNDFLELIYSTVLPWTGGILRLTASDFNYNSANKRHTVTEDSKINLIYDVGIRNANANRVNGILPASQKPSRHDFVYGENIINIDSEPSQKYPISAILPYGTYTETVGNQERPLWLFMAGIAHPYIYSSDSETLIGKVAKSIDFGNVGKFAVTDLSSAVNKLKDLATDWVNNHLRQYQDKMIVTGIDKYYIYGYSTSLGREIDVGDIIRIEAEPYNIDYYDYCLSLKVDYFNHENDQYVIGPYIPENELDYKVSNFIAKADQKKKSVKNKKNKKKG